MAAILLAVFALAAFPALNALREAQFEAVIDALESQTGGTLGVPVFRDHQEGRSV